MDGHQVPQQMVMEAGDTFKRILAEGRSLLSMVCVSPWSWSKLWLSKDISRQSKWGKSILITCLFPKDFLRISYKGVS